MNKDEIQLIIEEGEGYRIEFKESMTSIDKRNSLPLPIPQEAGYFLE